MTSSTQLTLTQAEESRLVRWTRSGTAPQRVVRRARIALLLATGQSPRTVARLLGVGVNTVARWRERVCLDGIDALTHDAPGRGRKRTTQPAWEMPLRETLRQTPPCGARWTIRALARSLGWSVTTTARRIKELRVFGPYC